MIASPTAVLESYWTEFEVTDEDVDFIDNLLLEREVPLTSAEMTEALVRRRLILLKEEAERAKEPEAQSYLPANSYQEGERLLFRSLDGRIGVVSGVRAGSNPELDPFEVIQVKFDDGGESKEFAAGLEVHVLNVVEAQTDEEQGPEDPEGILRTYSRVLIERVEERLRSTTDIVRIAGRWYHAGLLAEVNEGHRNLAEAVLDVSAGGPLPTGDLIQHMEMAEGLDPLLTEFSVDYALQEDERFDEVGPAGKVLWFLRRLEPPEALETPKRLAYQERTYDRSTLTPELLDLEALLDDEHGEQEPQPADQEEITLPLLYPHWQVGSLPLSSRLGPMFPTAYEAPRIRFILVDGHSDRKFPGWVVRQPRYIFGLRDWYREYDIPAGAVIRIRRGEQEGEVIVKAIDPRQRNDWIRTVTISGDGHIGFTMLKHPVGAGYDERMIVGLLDERAVAEAWKEGSQRHLPISRLVPEVFRELSKLNPQTTVHAQSLYSAVNVIRRSPPGPIFAELTTQAYYEHVGDHYWRLDEDKWRAE